MMKGGTSIVVLICVLVKHFIEKGVLKVESCKYTEFGVAVKIELLRRGKEQKWLEQQVSDTTGLFIDAGYIYKILTGQRNAPKVVKAIKEILNIPDDPQ